MEIKLSYYYTFGWFGFIQAWIYAFLLWYRARKNNSLSDALLGLVLVGIAFNLWEYIFGFSGVKMPWKELNFILQTLGFAFAPLFYFYFKSQVDRDFSFSKNDIIYFLPFIIFTSYHIGLYSINRDLGNTVDKNFHNHFSIFNIEIFGEILFKGFFIFKCLKLYHQHQKGIKLPFSDIQTDSLKWLRKFLIVLVLMFGTHLLRLVINSIFDFDLKQDLWANLVEVALIYYVCITGYSRAEPITKIVFIEEANKIESIKKERFNDNKIEDWKIKILNLMEDEKLYLQPELNLSDIANRLKTNISVLSSVINIAFGKNFNDFVNEYRVKEFQERILLRENKNITLLGVAFDCGFNSKATFNRSVKRFTNKSPKDLLVV